jgi:uncharacterized protein
VNLFRSIRAGAVATLFLAVPANAHVTVAPSHLAPGTFDELTFRCPNERPAAATTMLAVQLPQTAAIAFVSIRPLPGWHATVTKRKLTRPFHGGHGDITEVVDTITWSGGAIRPGEYQDFAILAGPMPNGVHALTFKAIQTYSNGEVVRWIELRGPGEPEPGHPAPSLRLQ